MMILNEDINIGDIVRFESNDFGIAICNPDLVGYIHSLPNGLGYFELEMTDPKMPNSKPTTTCYYSIRNYQKCEILKRAEQKVSS